VESTSTSTPVVEEEKRKFSLFPHYHHHRNKSKTHAEVAIRHPVVVQELERVVVTVMGASAVSTPKAVLLFPKVLLRFRNKAVLFRKGVSSEA